MKNENVAEVAEKLNEEEAEAVCSVLCQVEGFNYAERVRILQAALRDVETVQELEMTAARGES